jgi:hypothetical protein
MPDAPKAIRSIPAEMGLPIKNNGVLENNNNTGIKSFDGCAAFIFIICLES